MKARIRTVQRFTRPLAVAIGLAVTVGITSPRAFEGQNKAAAPAQKMDDEYTKKIVDSTPDKRILTELVDHMPLPADPKVPSPLKVLGYIPGEGGRLTYSADVYKYLDALDAASRARDLLVDRQDGRGPRHARLRRRRRGHDPRPRQVQEDHGRPHGPAQDVRRRGQAAHRHRQADLLGHRQHPLRRDRQRRDADGARLPPRDRGVAVHPDDPQQPDLRLHADDRSRRPRSPGRQPARAAGQPAVAVDGLLGQVRRARQQPRRHRQGPQALAERARSVPRSAPAGAARPARVGEPAVRLDGHRPVQPDRRSAPGQRVVDARAERDRRDDQARRAGRVDLQLLRRLGAELHVLDRRVAQRDRPVLRDAERRREHVVPGGDEPRVVPAESRPGRRRAGTRART